MRTALRNSETPSRRPKPRGNERRLVTQHPRRRILSLAASAAALPAVSRMAWGQAYPTRPITMIVPFPPGGPTDTIGRLLSERMRIVLGQPIVIENVTGASGGLGVGRAARAANDGYTLSIGQVGTHVFNGAAYPLQYDLQSDFDPMSLLTESPSLLIAKKATPANDLPGRRPASSERPPRRCPCDKACRRISRKLSR
jgi:tripartite-type tricarboxylate transporter receptor subunit TctC